MHTAPPPSDSPLMERMQRWLGTRPELVPEDPHTLITFLNEVAKDPDLSTLEIAELDLLRADIAFSTAVASWTEVEQEVMQAQPRVSLSQARTQGAIMALQNQIGNDLSLLRTYVFRANHGLRLRHIIAAPTPPSGIVLP